MTERGYTLISCIGAGMYDGGYRQTKYQFPTGKEYTTRLFLEAILKTGYRRIEKVILVGTSTSSWDVLIPDPSGEKNIDLWEAVLRECEDRKNGISDEAIAELEAKLPEWYDGIRFKLAVHSHELTPENVEKIFSTYIDIPNEFVGGTDILFDITHGFRSMPILLFQSLQLNSQKIEGRNVELIYGEYIPKEEISYVRDLSQYWAYYEISSAIKLFDEKLDGRLLAAKMKGEWESGAKAILRLSEIVENNLSLEVPEALKQLKNVLNDFSEDGKPQWLIDVKNGINGIYKKLSIDQNDKYPISKVIWRYSQLLRDKKLITQAVIALQITAETVITEATDNTKIGDYKWFRENGSRRLKDMQSKNRPLGWLENFRNQIAHGGGKNHEGNILRSSNIDSELKSADKAIRKLFDGLERGD